MIPNMYDPDANTRPIDWEAKLQAVMAERDRFEKALREIVHINPVNVPQQFQIGQEVRDLRTGEKGKIRTVMRSAHGVGPYAPDGYCYGVRYKEEEGTKGTYSNQIECCGLLCNCHPSQEFKPECLDCILKIYP